MTVTSPGRRRALAVGLSVALLTAPAATARAMDDDGAPTGGASSPAPGPTIHPTESPSPTDPPTTDPTPTDSVSPSPTDSPTSSPTGSPSSSPSHTPSSSPTHTTPQPSPSATETDGGGADTGTAPVEAPPIDEEATAAFAAATAQLRVLTDKLDAVQASLLNADTRIGVSSGHAAAVEIAAELAARRVEAIADQISAATTLLGVAHLSVEGLARRTYQDGAAGAWSTVLSAQSAADFTARASDLQTITQTRSHAITLVADLPTQIAVLRDQRDAAAAAARTARAGSTAAQDAHEKLTTDLAAAGAQVAPLKAQVAAAVIAATAAIPADAALAAQRLQESDRLGSDIVARSEALEAAGKVVEGTGSFARPATGVITSPYGWRVHPILGYRKLHTGTDFDGADGVVYAADDGVVIMTVFNSAYGNVTVIDHGMSGGRHFATFYAHQAGYFVHEGDVVRKGQPIGAVGATGLATGPHLHFEVRLDGIPVDPTPFLP